MCYVLSMLLMVACPTMPDEITIRTGQITVRDHVLTQKVQQLLIILSGQALQVCDLLCESF
jgi:hypothetical protein